jgi:hypothetical protein
MKAAPRERNLSAADVRLFLVGIVNFCAKAIKKY